MEKNCGNCYNSIDNNESDILCNKTCGYKSAWTPIPFKPSESDLLALESLRTGKEVSGHGHDKREGIYTGFIVKISPHGYTIDTPLGIASVEKVTPPEPQWHDITPEEFKEHWDKKVWMWDRYPKEASKRLLTGLNSRVSYPYASHCVGFKHASIIKPTRD